MDDKKVTFIASFPPIQTALRFSGNGDGARILIDIPESEMGEAVKLLLYRQVPLKVTIEPYEQEKPENVAAGGRTLKRSTAKHRVK